MGTSCYFALTNGAGRCTGNQSNVSLMLPEPSRAQGTTMRLDARTAATLTLPTGKTDVIHFDSGLAGFGLRIRAGAGGKLLRTWVFQYRCDGAQRRMRIGSADVMGIEAARQAARKALGAVANGQDPQGKKDDDKDKLTLRKAVDQFLAVKQNELRPNTIFETTRYLTGEYFEALHDKPLDAIKRADVATRIVAIAQKSGSATAYLARAKLSGFFSWALTMGMVEASPVVGAYTPPKNKPRERVLSDIELAAIWRAAGEDAFGKIIKLMILTACRREEIGGMAWGEFKADGTEWTLPVERSKNKRAHTLPVMPMMRSIIDTMPRLAGRDLLFGERSPNGFTSWDAHKTELDQRSGVAGWELRDIRRSVATKMADLGIQPHIIEQILNHQSGHKAGPAGIYNRSSYQNEVKRALGIWEDHIRALVEGTARVVVNFPQQTA